MLGEFIDGTFVRLIWHLTFSTILKSLICNILKVVLPIRSSMVEGAKVRDENIGVLLGSNVQVRLYDKNKEIIAHKRRREARWL